VFHNVTEALSSKGVFSILRQYLGTRPDLGIWKGICDAVLEPANPFDSKAKRAPRRWFVFFVLIAAILLGCFIYFNDLS